jgi:hypothetical protein
MGLCHPETVAVASIKLRSLLAKVPVPNHRTGTRCVLGSGFPWHDHMRDDGRFASGSQRSNVMVLWPALEKVDGCVPNALGCSAGRFWMCQGPHGRPAHRPGPQPDRSPAMSLGDRAEGAIERGRLARALKDAISRSSEPCGTLAARRVAGSGA